MGVLGQSEASLSNVLNVPFFVDAFSQVLKMVGNGNVRLTLESQFLTNSCFDQH